MSSWIYDLHSLEAFDSLWCCVLICEFLTFCAPCWLLKFTSDCYLSFYTGKTEKWLCILGIGMHQDIDGSKSQQFEHHRQQVMLIAWLCVIQCTEWLCSVMITCLCFGDREHTSDMTHRERFDTTDCESVDRAAVRILPSCLHELSTVLI